MIPITQVHTSFSSMLMKSTCFIQCCQRHTSQMFMERSEIEVNRCESFSCDWWLSESVGGELSEFAADVGYR